MSYENPYAAPTTNPREGKPGATGHGTREFNRDPRPLARVVNVLFGLLVGSSVLMTLTTINAGLTFAAPETSEEDALVAEGIRAFATLVWLVAMLLTVIPYLKWVYRTTWNAQGFGAQEMRGSPGWAVAFYFIPIISLFRPYQVMSDVWRASEDPRNYTRRPAPALLGWWWGLFLISCFGGNAIGPITEEVAAQATSLADLAPSQYALAALVAGFGTWAYLTMRVVAGLTRRQVEWVEGKDVRSGPRTTDLDPGELGSKI